MERIYGAKSQILRKWNVFIPQNPRFYDNGTYLLRKISDFTEVERIYASESQILRKRTYFFDLIRDFKVVERILSSKFDVEMLKMKFLVHNSWLKCAKTYL